MEGMNDEDITQELEIERYSNQVMRIPRYIGNFLVTKNLMETNSCVVVLASDPEVDEKIAIKCIPISETAIIAWDHEVQVMNSLDHPNIIKCLNYFQFPSDEPRFCTIVMPLAIYDLYTYVEKKMPLSEIKICRIFYDVINAVISMHRRSCWHRDIKLENILIIDETTPLPYAVVSDFGLSAYMPGEAVRGIGTGTLEYAAPELVETVYSESEHAFVRQFKQEAEYTNKIDSWCLGIALNQILFRTCAPFDLQGNIFFPPPPPTCPNISNEARDLIIQLTRYNPNERISITDAAEHQWFKNFGIYGTPPPRINNRYIQSFDLPSAEID